MQKMYPQLNIDVTVDDGNQPVVVGRPITIRWDISRVERNPDNYHSSAADKGENSSPVKMIFFCNCFLYI